MIAHARRLLAHWLRTLATRVDPDAADAFEDFLRSADACECGAMSVEDCGRLTGLRHCGAVRP